MCGGSRREFLKVSGIIGLGLAAYPVGACLAEAVKFDRELYKVSRSKIGMGTIVSLTMQMKPLLSPLKR
jgi:thiamine biosynthesis lipoprotein